MSAPRISLPPPPVLKKGLATVMGTTACDASACAGATGRMYRIGTVGCRLLVWLHHTFPRWGAAARGRWFMRAGWRPCCTPGAPGVTCVLRGIGCARGGCSAHDCSVMPLWRPLPFQCRHAAHSVSPRLVPFWGVLPTTSHLMRQFNGQFPPPNPNKCAHPPKYRPAHFVSLHGSLPPPPPPSQWLSNGLRGVLLRICYPQPTREMRLPSSRHREERQSMSWLRPLWGSHTPSADQVLPTAAQIRPKRRFRGQ